MAIIVSSNTKTIGSKSFEKTEEGDCPKKTATGIGDAPPPPPAKWRKDYYTQEFETTEVYAYSEYTLETNYWWWGGVIVGGVGLVLLTVATFGVGTLFTITIGSTVLTVTAVGAGTVLVTAGGVITTINQGSDRHRRGDFLRPGTETKVFTFTAELAPVDVVKCP